MENYQTQLISLGAGVSIAIAIWVITSWKRLELDWKGEVKAVMVPVLASVAAMLFAGMAWPEVVTAGLTMLGTAVGLNRNVLEARK